MTPERFKEILYAMNKVELTSDTIHERLENADEMQMADEEIFADCGDCGGIDYPYTHQLWALELGIPIEEIEEFFLVNQTFDYRELE